MTKRIRLRGHKGRPWYRATNDRYYVKEGGKAHMILDDDGRPLAGPGREVEAAALWVKMQLREQRRRDGDGRLSVRDLFSDYLDHTKEQHPGSYSNYRRVLVSFAASLPATDFAVGDLTAADVRAWWARNPLWIESTRSMRLGVVLAALNWAARPEVRLIRANPLQGMRRPRKRSRGADAVVSPEDHEAFLKVVPDEVRVMLEVLRETATRPVNLCRLEARHIDWERKVWVMPKHKTAEKAGRPLLVPMTPRVEEICREQAKRHPAGALFRDSKGNPWTSPRFSNRVWYWHKKAVRAGLQVPAVYYAYTCRHSRLTELLEAGVSETIVAAVAGHAGTRTLHSHYSHVMDSSRTIVQAVNAVPTARAPAAGTPKAPAGVEAPSPGPGPTDPAP
jgi:integrase